MRLILTFLIGVTMFKLTMAQNSSNAVRQFVAFDESMIAFVHATVVDGTGSPARDGQTVIISNGMISAAGPSDQIEVPDGAKVIDMTGKTLLPGFVMMHEHMYYPAPAPGLYHLNQLDATFPRLYLAGGATTIRTAGSIQPYSDLNIREMIENGEMAGPKIDVTGPYFNGPRGGMTVMKTVRTAQEAMEMAIEWADEGVTSFKAYENISSDALAAVIGVARARGIKVTGHLCSISFREAADLGIDNLEHGFMVASDFIVNKPKDVCQSGARGRSLQNLAEDAPEMKGLIDHLVQKNVAITSTLCVFETFAKDRPRISDEALESLTPPLRDHYMTTWNAVNASNDSSSLVMLRKEMVWEKAYADAGGLLLVGTDPTGYGGVIAGYANIRAVELLVESGFSPVDAIKIATFNGASYLNQLDSIGTIAVGKKADLIIVDGSPANNIADLRKIEIVFKDGIGYDSVKLFESVKGRVGLH